MTDDQLTEKVIGCAYTVSNTLGSGFLEKVYENALRHELTKCGLLVLQQSPISVRYDGVNVGDYFADLLVEGRLILELKAVRQIDTVHTAQTINYLRASGLKIALILNFGNPRVEVKRLRND